MDLSRAQNIEPHLGGMSVRPLEVTTPLMTLSDGAVEFHGSGVGLAIGIYRFVVTANHVAARRRQSALYGFGKDGLVSLGSDVTTARRDGGASDDIDVAVFRLDDHGAHWSASSFAQWPELDHSWPPPPRHSHLVVGYPESLNRKGLVGDTLSAMSYRLLGRDAQAEEYVAETCEPENHLMLGFDRKRVYTSSGQVTAPNQYGMSGCGAWRVGLEADEPAERPLLSAIMTEWRSKTRTKHMLGTRVHVVLRAIVSRHPDVGSTVAELLA